MNKPTIWFWVISGLGFLWNCFGALDYVMTRTQNEAYMGKFPPELLAYYYDMPILLDFTWPLAVWIGLLGWIFMLLRKRWAVPAFLLSLIAMIINFGYMAINGGLALQAEHMGAMSYISTALVIGIGIFAVWFSRREKAKGTLN